MVYTSILPYFVIMALCYLLASRLAWMMPADYFARAENQKHQTIEGMRSLLALSVFMTHSVVTYFYYQHGQWRPAPSGIYTLLGAFSVNIFFMITGFLFWDKAIQSEGKIDYRKLLPSRIRRIAPAYILAASIILVLIFWESGFVLFEPLGELLKKIAKFIFGLGLLSLHPINGVSATTALGAGVFWTLAYEWRFYLALPLIALLLRRAVPRPALYVASIGAFVYVVLYRYNQKPYELLFLCGMACAALYSRPKFREVLTGSRLLHAAGLVAVPMVFTLTDSAVAYSSIFLQALFFVALVHMHPETLAHRLLQTRPAKILGACSYSTYVLHGALLHISVVAISTFAPIKTATPLIFWVTIASIAVVVVIASLLSYRFVEHPFMFKRVKIDNRN